MASMRPPNGNVTTSSIILNMFDLFTPSQSMFETIGEVPNYVAESFFAFHLLLALESILLWAARKPLPRVPDVISSLGAGMIARFAGLFVRGIELIAYIWIWENCRFYELPWNSAWTWVCALFAVDFGYYWLHRCGHEINFMWAAHQIHHSSEDYNFSTALRQSALHIFHSWIFYLPLAFFMPPSVFLVHSQFNFLYQFWIHTELIGWLGPLEYIINTPSSHRVHHGRNRYCIDKNFGGIFIVWDIMFGTYEAEKRDDVKEKVVYGLVHPLESRNPFVLQLCHWQYILSTALFERKGMLNKLKTLVYGPLWQPKLQRKGLITSIPVVYYPQPKYENTTPTWYSAYALTHFVVISTLNSMIHGKRTELTEVVVLISIGFILLTLTSLGSVFDQRSYGPLLELMRCVGVLIYMYSTVELSEPSNLALMSLFVASSILFLHILAKQTQRWFSRVPHNTQRSVANGVMHNKHI